MDIRSRIVELRHVKASELLDNPKNWRRHSKEQLAAITGVLSDIGFAGAELAFQSPDGLMLIDGHARKSVAGDQEIPVLVTDLTPAEADVVLATFDPLGAMAKADQAQLDELIDGIQAGDAQLVDLLESLATESVEEATTKSTLVELNTRRPPTMTWVLIGIPTVRFGEIAATIEELATINDILLETLSNDREVKN